jgi:RHH-type proline utilization regulon transcriptional repressor/proline dehydrogenase/delta 1-pyrroline-5-carboxylate dehydrogenase
MRHPEDPTGLAAESNAFRYVPLRAVLLCRGSGPDASDAAVACALAAAAALGVDVIVCDDAGLQARAAAASGPPDSPWVAAPRAVDAATAAPTARNPGPVGPGAGREPGLDKVRFLGTVEDVTRLAAHDAGWWVDDVSVAADPGREVLRWVREQAVSERLHRHGNITGRRRGLGR